MNRHYKYISFNQINQSDIISMRKALLARIIPKVVCEILVIAAIFAIGKTFNIFLSDSFMEKMRNPSFIVFLIVLVVLIVLLFMDVFAIIQVNRLDVTDVIDSINKTQTPNYTLSN